MDVDLMADCVVSEGAADRSDFNIPFTVRCLRAALRTPLCTKTSTPAARQRARPTAARTASYYGCYAVMRMLRRVNRACGFSG